MTFDTLTIQNFLSIQSVAIPLNNQGLVLINGNNKDNPALNNNGAGKSSLLEAIIYVLYGKTIRGLKGDAVVNNKTGKNTKVFLDLTDDDGTKYRIARYRKHNVHKNNVYLYRNGVDITPKSESDFDNFIIDLLQADYTTFTSSLLYSAESFKFTTSTDAEIKRTFDTMLNLEVLEKCRDVTKQLILQVKDKLNTVNSKLDILERDLESVNFQLDSQRKEHDEWDENKMQRLLGIDSSKASLREKLNAINSEIESLNQDKKDVKIAEMTARKSLDSKKESIKKIGELKDLLSELHSEISDLKGEISKDDIMINNSQEFINLHDSSIQNFQSEIDNLQEKCDKLDTSKGQPCPVCGKPLDSEYIQTAKDEYLNQIQDKQSKIDELSAQVATRQKQIDDTQSSLNQKNTKLDDLLDQDKQLNAALDKCKSLEESCEKLEKRVERLVNQGHDVDLTIESKRAEFKHTTVLLNNLDSEHERVLQEINPFSQLLKELYGKQSHIEGEISLQSELIPSLEEKLDCLNFWERAYSNQGIKSFILDDITPFLNRRVNKYLSKLTSGQIEVVFSTRSTLKSGEEREKFSIEVVNQNGGEQYSSNSGGERKRIDLAINLALQDLVASRSSKKINIAIFDEVFDALDEQGIDGVVYLLQELAQSKSTILVVSHNEYLKAYFTNTWTMVKQDGYSFIQNGDVSDE